MSQGIFRVSAISVASALALAGCSLAPKYERPLAPVPAHYPELAEQGGQVVAATPLSGVQASADLGWREFFRDPRLQAYIALALENNRDMRIAIERIQEARAQYGIVDSDRLPTIGIGGNGQITRNPPDLRAGGPDSDSVSRFYSAGVGITSFELDFFGRVRNLSEAARQQYLATTEARRTMHINVVALVAEAYFRLRTAQELQGLNAKTLESRLGSYKLVQARFNAGVASALDVYQARSQLDSIYAEEAAVKRMQAQAVNALRLLVGGDTDIDVAGLTFGRDQLLAQIPVGLPSDLLERRPDIMGAEHGLLAANANIGAARAAFFPRISITGLLGFASPQLGGLFGAGNRYWQFSPQLVMPIFAGGVSGGLDLAKARNNIAVAQYEQAIQTAFREVADALAGEATYTQQLDALRSLEGSASNTLRLARLRYETGIDSFLQVQSAEVDLYTTQRTFLETGMDSLMNRVELYKALGGGWLADTASTQASAAL
ncbi:MAG: efflux transporter outer membrane subunit [Burkholderiaceae bacterium]|nr:efflux transporter outer membrane subunit [Burkholderiaceae bacterium]